MLSSQVTYADIINKMNTVLLRVPVKLQECFDQINEVQQQFALVVEMYEKKVQEAQEESTKYQKMLEERVAEIKSLEDKLEAKSEGSEPGM